MRLAPLIAVATLATTLSCSRDPEGIKKKYIQTGNKYFAAGKHRQAAILHRSALRKDAKFAEAYYRWALAEISPLHKDVPYIVRRLNELRRMR